MPYIKFKNNNMRKRYWLGPDGIALINDWRRRGVSLDDIAKKKIGVTFETLQRWRQESDELDHALTITEDLVDGQVEGSLLTRALGYDYFEETWVRDKNTGQEVLTKRVKKHVPADTRAIAMWLYNRRALTWHSQQPMSQEDEEGIIDVKNVLVAIEGVAEGDGGEADREAG